MYCKVEANFFYLWATCIVFVHVIKVLVTVVMNFDTRNTGILSIVIFPFSIEFTEVWDIFDKRWKIIKSLNFILTEVLSYIRLVRLGGDSYDRGVLLLSRICGHSTRKILDSAGGTLASLQVACSSTIHGHCWKSVWQDWQVILFSF